MAYLPPSLSQRQRVAAGGGLQTGGASDLGGSGISAAPTGGGTAPGAQTSNPTPAGGRFAALRGFLDANQAAVDTAAQSIAQPIESKAQEAVSLAGESAALPENKGGSEKAADASAARDDALSRIAAASQGVVGDLPTAGYQPGAQAADAYLYSRSAPIQGLKRWDPVLRALNPGYGDPYYDPPPPPPLGEVRFSGPGAGGPDPDPFKDVVPVDAPEAAVGPGPGAFSSGPLTGPVASAPAADAGTTTKKRGFR